MLYMHKVFVARKLSNDVLSPRHHCCEVETWDSNDVFLVLSYYLS